MRTLITLLLLAAPLAGQKQSPHETAKGTVSGANLEITYGRPYLKGRTVGTSFVPYGKVWRLGADEATTLKTDKTIMLGTLTLPAGTYALFAIPNADSWKLIVNKKAEQWGLDHEQNKSEDLGQTSFTVSKNPAKVEQLTIAIENSKLRVMWDTTAAEVPIRVK